MATTAIANRIYTTSCDPNTDREIARRADGTWFARFRTRLRDGGADRWAKIHSQFGPEVPERFRDGGKNARLPKD